MDTPAMIKEALRLHEAGDVDGADRAYRRILSLAPRDPDALHLRGVLLHQAGEEALAEEHIEKALAERPGDADFVFNLAEVQRARGRASHAAENYLAVLRARGAHPDVFYGLGRSLEALGDHGGAAESFRRNLELAPQDVEALNGLGDCLTELGSSREAAHAYRRAIAARPEQVRARLMLARVLRESNQPREALEEIDAVLARRPRLAQAHFIRGRVLAALGAHDAALSGFEQTVRLAPEFAQAHVELAALHLHRDAPARALEVCDRFLEAHPGSPPLLALREIVLRELGRDAEAAALLDFDRLIRLRRLEELSGPGTGPLCAALTEHVLAHPTLTWSPTSRTTRKGRHSGDLLARDAGPVEDLEAALQLAIGSYIEQVGRDPAHPFLADPPRRWRLNMWAVVLEEAGHQLPHIHPFAWLSGVCYPQVPPVVSRSGARAGWIEFGRPPDEFRPKAAPRLHSVRPETGLLVLFPSYFYHGTVPFEGRGTRVSIAFDVMREA